MINGKRLAEISDIQSAIDFAADSKRLLVCCRAGQSRSAAVAFSIAFQKLGEDVALTLLNPKRHAPNSFVIGLAASIIEDPRFETVFQNWQTAHASVKLSDYVDEIESELDVLELKGARNLMVKS